MSILLALGVRAWQDGRATSQLIDRSLRSFHSEIMQNRNRLEELYRYHAGLQSVLLELNVDSHPDAIEEVRNVLASFQTVVLLTSAWETALATGALAQMDYETVFALSLTYSFQQRFDTLYNSRLVEALGASAQSTALPVSVWNAANRYVQEITGAESDLLAAYEQELELLESVVGNLPPAKAVATAKSSP